ncbi:MAG: hypothetical protein AAGA90_11325 [Actinomycetota bacterium]
MRKRVSRLREAVDWDYRINSYMEKGPGSTFKGLTIAFLILFVFVGLARAIFVRFYDGPVERGRGFIRQIWLTWLEMTDPGTQAYDIDSAWWFKGFAIVSALLGIVFLSAVIAVMTAALDRKERELRSGHSKVKESDHTVILGWNDRVLTILRELIEANESEPSACVVILSELEKEEMDEYLRTHLPQSERASTKIVTRNGVPTAPLDVGLASPEEAKSVIVLGVGDDELRSDAGVIKAITATLIHTPDHEIPIVAELIHEENKELAAGLAGDRVLTIDAEEILAKVIVQCSRSEGLSVVYREVLSFDGAELYLFDEHNAGGKVYGEIAYHLPDGVAFGVQHADGEVSIRPHPNTVIADDDVLIVLAEDDSTLGWEDERIVEPSGGEIPDLTKEPIPERELIVGWTRKSETIVREYAEYVSAGSEIDIVSRNGDMDLSGAVAALDDELDGLAVRLREVDPHSSKALADLNLSDYNNVIILSQPSPSCTVAEDTDSDTLSILLRLRSHLYGAAIPDVDAVSSADRSNLPMGRLVSEVLDETNEEILVHAGVRDVVISNRVVSSIIAQISEQPEILKVYEALFVAEGSEIYLKPATWYFDNLPRRVSFADILERATLREEQALGFRDLSSDVSADPEKGYGVRLNPAKDEFIYLTEADKIVVLAEDEY